MDEAEDCCVILINPVVNGKHDVIRHALSHNKTTTSASPVDVPKARYRILVFSNVILLSLNVVGPPESLCLFSATCVHLLENRRVPKAGRTIDGA